MNTARVLAAIACISLTGCKPPQCRFIRHEGRGMYLDQNSKYCADIIPDNSFPDTYTVWIWTIFPKRSGEISGWDNARRYAEQYCAVSSEERL